MWPGVSYIEYTGSSSVTQQKQKTATITTVKTTKAHLNVIGVRDTLHQVNNEYYAYRLQTTLILVSKNFLTAWNHYVVVNCTYLLAPELREEDHG